MFATKLGIHRITVTPFLPPCWFLCHLSQMAHVGRSDGSNPAHALMVSRKELPPSGRARTTRGGPQRDEFEDGKTRDEQEPERSRLILAFHIVDDTQKGLVRQSTFSAAPTDQSTQEPPFYRQTQRARPRAPHVDRASQSP